MPTIIYKLCETALWHEAERAGVFHGTRSDRRDGFIHLSTASQARETAAKHFVAVADLTLGAKPLRLGADRRHSFPELAP